MAQIIRHNPASVHAPSSGYSMGLELGQHRRLLFVSGQVPENQDGGVPEGFEAQCEQAWRNVIEVLTAVALALILWYGGGETLRGTMTVGVVAAAGGSLVAADGGDLRYGRSHVGVRVDGFTAWGDAAAAKRLTR